MQHPVRQYLPQGHGFVASHRSAGHALFSESVQSLGTEVLPRHRSQRPHGFTQSVIFSHGGHFSGLPRSSTVQLLARRTRVERPNLSNTSQQPAQSQPFGVFAPQYARHLSVA